jgi:hypothetical protein
VRFSRRRLLTYPPPRGSARSTNLLHTIFRLRVVRSARVFASTVSLPARLLRLAPYLEDGRGAFQIR